MKLYVTHASGYDYTSELYTPLKKEFGSEHEIVFPHEQHEEGMQSKDILPTCDAVVAEVTYPSTGQGIELGWADASRVPIICMHRSDAKVSSALRFLGAKILTYDSAEDMVAKLRLEIEKIS